MRSGASYLAKRAKFSGFDIFAQIHIIGYEVEHNTRVVGLPGYPGYSAHFELLGTRVILPRYPGISSTIWGALKG